MHDFRRTRIFLFVAAFAGLLLTGCIEDPHSFTSTVDAGDIDDSDDGGFGDDVEDAEIECGVGYESCMDDAGGSSCVDITGDRAHCGGCGASCEVGEVCSMGSCSDSCDSGLTDCEGSCIDLESSDLHCGACENSCTGDEVCQLGSCEAESCTGEQTTCNDECVEIGEDPEHCTGCGEECTEIPENAEPTCSEGECGFVCPEETPDLCGDSCVASTNDADHCGSCYASCQGGCFDAHCETLACNGETPLADTAVGTEDDPYRICSAGHLDAVRTHPERHFVLTRTIDMAPFLEENDFEAIPNFSGTFKGDGHSIENLVIRDLDGEEFIGLFASLESEAVVSNLRLTQFDVEGADSVGVLAGENRGRITAVHATGVVSGDMRVGGLVGWHQGAGVIEHSSSSVVVTGSNNRIGGLAGAVRSTAQVVNSRAEGNVYGGSSDYVGGFVGQTNDDTQITDSHATGDVFSNHSDASFIGGFAGRVRDRTSITGSTSAGNVIAPAVEEVGGLIGGIVDVDDVQISNCSVTGITQGHRNVGGLVGRIHPTNSSIAQAVISESSAAGNVIATANKVGGLIGTNYGQVVDSFALGTVRGDGRVGGLVGENYGPVVDSFATGDVTSTNSEVGGLIGYNGAPDTAWEDLDRDWSHCKIIGSRAEGNITQLSGDFDAGGLVGKHINDCQLIDGNAFGQVSAVSVNSVGGLIGAVLDDATVITSHAIGDVVGDGSVGGLVGYFDSSVILQESSASGQVLAGSDSAGGLVGWLNGTISDSYARGDVYSDASSIGGLVGWFEFGVIQKSYATGMITGTGDNSFCGGLVGKMVSDTEVRLSFAAGDIFAPGYYRVGGLVGEANGDGVYNSYASGQITGDDQVGGLVGKRNAGVIDRSYSTGFVTGASSVGGLVGDGSSVDDSYWDQSTSGQNDSNGGVGLNSLQFGDRDSFPGWNFANIVIEASETIPWIMVEDAAELSGLEGDSQIIRPRLWFEFLQ